MSTNAEFDVILDQLEAAGMVEVCTDGDGDGDRVVRQLAMIGDDGQDALMGPWWKTRGHENQGPHRHGGSLWGR